MQVAPEPDPFGSIKRARGLLPADMPAEPAKASDGTALTFGSGGTGGSSGLEAQLAAIAKAMEGLGQQMQSLAGEMQALKSRGG